MISMLCPRPRPHAPRRVAALLAAVLAALLLAACSGARMAAPQAIAPDTLCVLDGMALAEFPGPKGQIVYDHGDPDFFCNTRELLAAVLQPEQRRRILGVYTQDVGAADWTHPDGHWIDARRAYYVAGSRRDGSMGPTLASLASEAAAREFVTRYGGQVLRFDEITPQVLEQTSNARTHGGDAPAHDGHAT